MIHDTSTSRKNDISDISSRQKLIRPCLQIWETDVESGGNDTTFVEATVQLNDNLSRSMVVDFFKFSDVSMFLHYLEEFDNDFAGWADQDLALASFLGIVLQS